MNSRNRAASKGWIRTEDPISGRTYFANTVTRKTQWEAPEGWVEEPSQTLSDADNNNDEDSLPSNWEVMHDPSTGKPFYVDHERKITQWTRPKAEKRQEPVISYAPANATTSTAMPRILNAADFRNYSQRTYSQEASYFRNFQAGPAGDIDLSDSMPALDFSVRKVADKYRPECPDCNSLFTLSKRRHHCRLCGDVFCDSCSNHRVLLPLEGVEFEKPVRICNFCNRDVEQGNFFSMRRYLTPLALFDPELGNIDDDGGVATPKNVNAALAAIALDLDQLVQNSEGFEGKVTIPPDILVPSILKHLSNKFETSERAIRALASLLAVGSIVGKNDFAHAVYLHGGKRTLDQIFGLLERSGTDRRTLFVQEKAAQTLFYLTDPQIVVALLQKQDRVENSNGVTDEEFGKVESLDMQRCLRNMLDHSSTRNNPNLQRWSTATVRNIVIEDQRRACMAINEVAANVASGDAHSPLQYESFLEQLVSTGGVMILCSLIGADDSDTRAHATGALGAMITATRAIDDAMIALSEMTGGLSGRLDRKDGDIVRAIVSGGGVGSSVSQLLLSADNSVAGMGCGFVASLVKPLLSDPEGNAALPTKYDWRNDRSGLAACREAALEISNGSCLPALLSLAREGGRLTRRMDLRCLAMETFAATAVAVGEMARAWAGGKYEEGMERNGTPAQLTRAVTALNAENVVAIALEVLQSSSVQSLGSSRDTPATRIREAAGIVLGAVTSCSAEAIMELHSRQVLKLLILASNDPSMTAPSCMRGDSAPRCVGMLEAASAVLMFSWRHPSGASSDILDRLLEALDVGAITSSFQLLSIKVDWDSRKKSTGNMKALAAGCRFICCLFGIALTDDTSIGIRRLMEACDADQSSRRLPAGPRNITEAVLTVLQASLACAHNALTGAASRESCFQAALSELVESALLATGSICGSAIAPGGSDGVMITGDQNVTVREDGFGTRRKNACKVACDLIVRNGRSSQNILPTMLVGGFGEGAIGASLRLALAIAQNGNVEQHSKLAFSGIFVPIADLLKSALKTGDIYLFSASLSLVRFCGPFVSPGASGDVQAIHDVIRAATNVLTLPVIPGSSYSHAENQESLKGECIAAIESLSKNSALWSSICADALPSIVSYLSRNAESDSRMLGSQLAALRALFAIVQVPSHANKAAEIGLAVPLGNLLNRLAKSEDHNGIDCQILALQILHSLMSKASSRRHCKLISSGAVASVCAAVGSTISESQGAKSSRMAFLGLEILHYAIADIEAIGETPLVLQSSDTLLFLDSVAADQHFIRALCSSFLRKTGMKLKYHGSDETGKTFLRIPEVYGAPLEPTPGPCGGFQSFDEASQALLFTVSLFASAVDAEGGTSFWNCALAQDMKGIQDDEDCKRAGAAFASFFLYSMIGKGEYSLFSQLGDEKKREYEDLRFPLVRYRLLEALRDFLADRTAPNSRRVGIDDFTLSLFIDFNITHVCLLAWRDPALMQVSFELLKTIVDTASGDVLHLFVDREESLLSLLESLSVDYSSEVISSLPDTRRFLTSILEKLAEEGSLVEAIERYGVKSIAVGALAAACLAEESKFSEDEEELTSNRVSNGIMRCLVKLCCVQSNTGERAVSLSSQEAESIAQTLGKKICQMVISRFLERAKLQEFEIEGDDKVMDAPDVAMLSAICQHEKSLKIILSIGGSHALAQVAGEGGLSMLEGLRKGCKGNPALLLEGDIHRGILSLFRPGVCPAAWRMDDNSRHDVEHSAFQILAQLCLASTKGKQEVYSSPDFEHCLDRAIQLVSPSKSQENSDHNVSLDTGNSCETKGHGEFRERLSKSALQFIASVASTQHVQQSILMNDAFLAMCTHLARSENHNDLKVCALQVIANLTSWTGEKYSYDASQIGAVLKGALQSEEVFPSEESALGSIGTHVIAADAIQYLYPKLPMEAQVDMMGVISQRYGKVLRERSLSKYTNANMERWNCGKLAYSLTNSMLSTMGNEMVWARLEDSLFTALAGTVQWYFDPKSELAGEDDVIYWNAASTQALQVLAHHLSLDSTKEQRLALKDNIWMVARPGKAARRAMDFVAALNCALRSNMGSTQLAAMRVLACLERD